MGTSVIQLQPGDVCIHRTRGAVGGRVVRIASVVSPPRPGKPSAPPTHARYETQPATENGAYGRDLTRVEGEFPLQVAAWVETLSRQAVANNPRAFLTTPPPRLIGLAGEVAELIVNPGDLVRLTLLVDVEIVNESRPSLHSALPALAAEVRRRHAAGDFA
jgi:hypothetical protein